MRKVKSKIEKAKEDCIFFAENYLKHLIPLKTGEFQKQLIEIVTRKENDRLNILAPRGHAKSTWITIIFSIWNIIRNREISIIIASDTMDQAESFLRTIKDELENNQSLIADFGEFRPKERTGAAQVWRANDITVIREGRSKESTIMCAGAGKKILGKRADLIIVDDPLNDENTESNTQRYKTYRWFMKTLTPILRPKIGRIIVIGTRKHPEDLHENLRSNKMYRQYIFKAVNEEKRVLWPEVWDYETLMKKRDEIGDLFFEQEYQNEAVDEKNQMFGGKTLEILKDRDYKEPANAKIYCGIYLPLHMKDELLENYKNHNTVIIILKRVDNGDTYLHKMIYSTGLTINEMLNRMKGTISVYEPEITCIEQEIYEMLDMNSLLDEGLGIEGHDKENRNNIYNGIPRIVWKMERGKIHFDYKDRKHETEFILDKFRKYGFENMNEFVIAYWLAEQAIRKVEKADNILEVFDFPY